jgi:hypothetical protein
MSRSFSCAAAGSLAILLVTFDVEPAEKSPTESSAIAQARQNVTAALKAEVAGDNDQRAELLASAISAAPDLPEANWHLGKVRADGKWLTLSEAQEQSLGDAQIQEYHRLRDEVGGNPKLLRNLARWCAKNGWHEIGRVHDLRLLSRNDVDADTQAEAIKRLDLRNVGGAWLTSEELKQRQQRQKAVEAALNQWRPRLKRLQSIVDGDQYAARQRAIQELAAIDDPQAILVLESFLLDGGDRFCEEAVKLLSRFPQIEATEALVRFAVLSRFSAARNAAIAALKDRPKHDSMPLLVSSLVAPLNTQFSISVGKGATVHYTHAVVEESPSAKVVSIRNQVAFPGELAVRTGVFLPKRGGELPLVMSQVGRAQQAAMEVQVQAAMANSERAQANRPIFEALEQLADAQVPRDANQWWNWWQDYNQYYWPKPTLYAYGYQPTSYIASLSFRAQSCFIAGTLVRTQLGLQPIESIQAGDRVLAQDQDSGELAYKAVMGTTVRPPAKLVRITTTEEQIVTTLGHPFWVNGHGWKMAKELEAGDLLHSLGGSVRVDKVEPAGEDKAYNLVVDDFNTYFVGQAGLLVHDNEFRKPTRAVVPGLVETDTGR